MVRGRTNINTMTMINWRGIPFQVIDMDRLLTALEGKNGAGKTTVLTAFYIAQLPDLTLVKIPNIGDSDGYKKEKGLHGKLGETGPVYSILEFITQKNERVFAGVQLYAKSAPIVEIGKMFVICNIPRSVKIEQILTFESEDKVFVPEVNQIEQRVAIYGGEMNQYHKIGDYGSRLFGLGVLPLKLTDKTSREKFNRLLQTSLQGGFSSGLQEKLKDYLLPDYTEISASISHMDHNLNQCRITRKNIENLSQRIHSVEKVYSTSKEMMTAVLISMKLREELLRKEVIHLRSELSKARTEYRNADLAHKASLLEQSLLDVAVSGAKDAFEKADDHLKKVKEAVKTRNELAGFRDELAVLEEQLTAAAGAVKKAEDNYSKAQSELKRISEEVKEISLRISDAVKKWEALSREAGLYKTACEALENVKAVLPEREVTPETAPTLLEECRAEEKSSSSEVAAISQRVQSAERLREDFTATMETLVALVGDVTEEKDAWMEACKIDRVYQEIQRKTELMLGLRAQLPDVEKKAKLQQKFLLALQSIGVAAETKDVFVQIHNQVANEITAIEVDITKLTGEIESVVTFVKQLENDKKEAEGKFAQWNSLIAFRDKLEEELSAKLHTHDAIDDLRKNIATENNQLVGRKSLLESEKAALSDRISDIVKREAVVDPLLENLEKELDGKLVISLYNEIDLSEAAQQEARLGPLVNAIMVDDVAAAVEKLESLNPKNVPEEVWLVEKCKLDSEVLKYYRLSGQSIIARMDKISRVTRLPKHPIVGREARKRLLRELREDREKASNEFQTIDAQIQNLSNKSQNLMHLSKGIDILCGQDPHDKVRVIVEQIQVAKGKIAKKTAEREGLEKRKEEPAKRVAILAECLPYAYLIDDEDYSVKQASLEKEIADCGKSQKLWNDNNAKIVALRENMQALRVVPPTKDELVSLQSELQEKRSWRDYWYNAVVLLGQLTGKIADFRFQQSFEQKLSITDPADELRSQQRQLLALQDEITDQIEEIRKVESDAKAHYNEVSATHMRKHKDIEGCVKKLQDLAVDASDETLSKAIEERGASKSHFDELTEKKNKIVGTVEFQEKELKAKQELKKQALAVAWEKVVKQHRPAKYAYKAATAAFKAEKTLAIVLSSSVDNAGYESEDAAFEKAGEQRASLKTYFEETTIDIDVQARVIEIQNKLNALPRNRACEASDSVLHAYLMLWSEIIGYISQILPRDHVHTDNPEIAVEQMRERYESLKNTLAQQEKDFQVDASNVATSIRAKIRTEASQIRKFNTLLDGMAFGNIRSIKIDFKEREEMIQILDVMQNNEQWNLFAEEESLAETMNKIYRQKTGGRAYGEDLLDYKKYISLTVKVMRKSSNSWEASFLSTGEAIGTGAAILMVILMVWEKTASFFRDSDAERSLRFLFIDEATRLDKESIGTLLDFCKKLEIQLLLAGPRFEFEECGRGITYRLVRENYEDSERVLISGRAGFATNVNEAAA